MTEQQTLPHGKKLCPGWTSEFSPETGVGRNGYAERYSATKASGSDVKYACGSGARGGDQSVIRDTADMCSRCQRQKTKFDEEHGAKQKREQEFREQYLSLIEAYRQDIQNAIPSGTPFSLALVVAAVDGLKSRAERAPHARYGEEGYRATYFNDREPSNLDRMNVLRRLVGLDVQVPRR